RGRTAGAALVHPDGNPLLGVKHRALTVQRRDGRRHSGRSAHQRTTKPVPSGATHSGRVACISAVIRAAAEHAAPGVHVTCSSDIAPMPGA
ncbi:MAG: hypothetical protein ACK4OP_03055, partial [Gemmobacter sp.]